MQKPHHIHFIGICGVAMSALAIALHKKGYKITGSDKGFFPPVSEHLKNAGVEYYPGWHVDQMTKDGNPDLVVVGNVAGSNNSEWLYVQKNNLPYVSYPELIKKYFVKKKSIVCAGTYGKTTSASLLTWILKENGYDPSYMFGGISLNEIDAAHLSDSSSPFPFVRGGVRGRVVGEYSVLEGDEYKSARWDNRPKFAHYSPTHLLLTSVDWDHADVYPTETLYNEAFQNLIDGLPENGVLVVSEEVDKIKRLKDYKIIRYGAGKNNDYQYRNISMIKEGVRFEIKFQSFNLSIFQSFNLQSSLAGDFIPKIITGCFAMAHQIGIEPAGIIKAIASWKGLKRRLEKRLDKPITVFDDIAHSPAKARAVLATVRRLYNGRITTIFEPNTGNRKQESIPGYANAFNDADEIIIPRLTQIKIAKDDPSPPCDGEKLAEVISATHGSVRYIDDDEKLVQYIVDNASDGDVVVFMGSHGFRGMIEALIKQIK
ncbi:MAG: Mur ligase domain-containing protein [Patescibacteria group bacterium]